MKDKKPRNTRWSFKSAPEFHGGILRIDPSSGEAFIIKDGKNLPLPELTYELYYERTVKNKTISKITSSNKASKGITELSLLASYDQLYGIDTNYMKLGTDDINVTCILNLQVIDNENDYTVNINPKAEYLIFKNIASQEAAEKIAWKTFIAENFDILGWLAIGCKIAILVDAFLKDIEAYNQRLLPLYEDFYLPENITLIYSTADTKDSLGSKIIHYADAAANELKKYILEGTFLPKFTHISHKNFEAIQAINKERFEILNNTIPKEGLSFGEGATITLWGKKDG